jgi:diguanylate cyclase (GGDEF)-like protein
MSGKCEAWKAKDLAWRKKYRQYHDEVLEYELYAQRQFSMYNAIVFLIYGIVSFVWNSFIVRASTMGSLLCMGVCLLSTADYIICRTFLEEHIKYSALAANLYILVLGKMLLSIDLIWNGVLGGNVSWTLLVCSLITTAMISVVPSHYAITILGVVALDTIECIISNNGALIPVLYNLMDGVIVAIFCIGMNIIYSRHQYAEFNRKEELKFESNRDLLTQLYNRRYIERCYEVQSDTKRLCAMIVLDLDNFKMANDIYGHKKGDEVLCAVGEILQNNFRNSDCVARLGGDEFAVFLPEITQKEAVVERVHEVLKKFPIVITGGKRVDVSVSIGVAYKNPGEDMTYEKLCDKADEAMYRAKRLGKGKAVVSAERNTKELVIVA